jgi:hypothetical protein
MALAYMDVYLRIKWRWLSMSEVELLPNNDLYKDKITSTIVVLVTDKCMSVILNSSTQRNIMSILYGVVFKDVSDYGYQLTFIDSPTLYNAIEINRKYEIDLVGQNVVGLRATTRRTC